MLCILYTFCNACKTLLTLLLRHGVSKALTEARLCPDHHLPEYCMLVEYNE